MIDQPAPVDTDDRATRLARWALGFAIAAVVLGVVALVVAIGARNDGSDGSAPASVDVTTSDEAPTTPAPSTTPAPAPSTTPTTPAPSTTPAPAPTSDSSTLPETSSTMLPATTLPADLDLAVWPRPESTLRFDDPVEAAASFATEVVGFDAPVLGGYRAGDSRSGEVEVTSRGVGPVTTVLVRQLDGDDWTVIGAHSDNITVDQPQPLSEVSSPLVLTGWASVFEGTVQVRLVSDGSDVPIVSGFVTGGSGPDGAPFAGMFEWTGATTPGATLILYWTSPEDGSVVEATVFRVRLHEVAV